MIGERSAQLVECREGQLHLGLHAHHGQHPEVAGGGDRVVEEGGLPDARLAVEDQGAAGPRARRRQDAVQCRALGGPAHQARRTLGRAVPVVGAGAAHAGSSGTDAGYSLQ